MKKMTTAMKKNYISPTITIVKIKRLQLMAGSSTIPTGESGSASNAESRRYGLDDFDYDDEYDY